MELSLTARELLRQTRRRGMYASRVIVPGSVSAALLALLAFNPDVRPETVGTLCFFVALAFQYGVAFLATPLMTADLIAREKEERTLPLLLLANARSIDIVASKYISVLLICELLILSTLPLIAFAGFFGGVDIGLGAAATLVNMAAAGAFAALGLLASSLTNQPRMALWLAYVFIAACAWSATWLFPRAAVLHEGEFLSVLRQLAPLFALAGGVVVAALAAAAWFIAHDVVDSAWRIDWLARRRAPTRRPRGSVHALRVIATHAGPRRGGMQRALMAMLLLALIAACLIIGPTSIPLLIVMIAYQTASNVRRVVHSGALDDLRLLPIDRWQLGDAVFHKHFLSATFLIPAFLASVVTIGSFGYADPAIVVLKLAVAAPLAFALVRYIVAIASQLAMTTRPPMLALLALVLVFVNAILVSLLAAVLFLAGYFFIGWFRLFGNSGPLMPSTFLYSIVWYVLMVGTLMGGARDPRLRFAQQLERDLARRL